jgi:hypothetical protein
MSMSSDTGGKKCELQLKLFINKNRSKWEKPILCKDLVLSASTVLFNSTLPRKHWGACVVAALHVGRECGTFQSVNETKRH